MKKIAKKTVAVKEEAVKETTEEKKVMKKKAMKKAVAPIEETKDVKVAEDGKTVGKLDSDTIEVEDLRLLRDTCKRVLEISKGQEDRISEVEMKVVNLQISEVSMQALLKEVAELKDALEQLRKEFDDAISDDEDDEDDEDSDDEDSDDEDSDEEDSDEEDSDEEDSDEEDSDDEDSDDEDSDDEDSDDEDSDDEDSDDEDSEIDLENWKAYTPSDIMEMLGEFDSEDRGEIVSAIRKRVKGAKTGSLKETLKKGENIKIALEVLKEMTE